MYDFGTNLTMHLKPYFKNNTVIKLQTGLITSKHFHSLYLVISSTNVEHLQNISLVQNKELYSYSFSSGMLFF